MFRVDGCAPNTCLRIALRRESDDPAEIAVVLALPPLAVDGSPEELLLDVLGDASGCRLFLEAGDAQGLGFSYSFGNVGFMGRRACAVDVREPCEYWGGPEANAAPRVVAPLQLHRLGLAMPESCRGVYIGLGALKVTGNVRLAPSGIAASARPRS